MSLFVVSLLEFENRHGVSVLTSYISSGSDPCLSTPTVNVEKKIVGIVDTEKEGGMRRREGEGSVERQKVNK